MCDYRRDDRIVEERSRCIRNRNNDIISSSNHDRATKLNLYSETKGWLAMISTPVDSVRLPPVCVGRHSQCISNAAIYGKPVRDLRGNVQAGGEIQATRSRWKRIGGVSRKTEGRGSNPERTKPDGN